MADQSNAGRNALIVGVVLGLAGAGLGVYTMMENKVERTVAAITSDTRADSLAAEAEQLLAEKERNRTIVDVAPEGAQVNGKPRFTPLFFSPELWEVSLDDQKKNTVIDIYDPTAENLHGQVPNTWFISNGIADALGRADGLELDSDGDGFTNREEFAARTSPSDPTSLPPLVKAGAPPKLEVVRVENANATITVDSMLAYDANPTEAGIRVYARVADSQPIVKCSVKPGGTFGLGGKSNPKRFTVLGFEKASFTDGAGNTNQESVLRVRDNVTVSGEKEFIIRAGRPRPKDKDQGTPNAKGRTIRDTTVTLRVTAGPMAGKPEGTFQVPYKGTFKVPGSDISCVLESVDDAGTVNVLPEGAESPVQVPKAAK